jgi:hypothetical protein
VNSTQLEFVNSNQSSQQVAITLSGYNISNSLVGTKSAYVTVAAATSVESAPVSPIICPAWGCNGPEPVVSIPISVPVPSSSSIAVPSTGLQAQIQALYAQIQQLEAQLKQQGQTTSWCYTFTTNLSIGMTGSGVTALQTALQKDGESVTVNGTFDDQTASAVTGFQQKYESDVLTPSGLQYGTGYAGSYTRTKLNSLYGCGM